MEIRTKQNQKWSVERQSFQTKKKERSFVTKSSHLDHEDAKFQSMRFCGIRISLKYTNIFFMKLKKFLDAIKCGCLYIFFFVKGKFYCCYTLKIILREEIWNFLKLPGFFSFNFAHTHSKLLFVLDFCC